MFGKDRDETFYKMLRKVEGGYSSFYAYNNNVFQSDVLYKPEETQTVQMPNQDMHFYGCSTPDDVAKYFLHHLEVFPETSLHDYDNLVIVQCIGTLFKRHKDKGCSTYKNQTIVGEVGYVKDIIGATHGVKSSKRRQNI